MVLFLSIPRLRTNLGDDIASLDTAWITETQEQDMLAACEINTDKLKLQRPSGMLSKRSLRLLPSNPLSPILTSDMLLFLSCNAFSSCSTDENL